MMVSDNLNGIVGDESYVLAIQIAAYFVELQMDFAILPNHPAYFSPRKDEQQCFRRGVLRICGFTEVRWQASGLRPATDSTGTLDWGHLDEFVNRDTHWRLGGDWGVIEIDGGTLRVQLDEEDEPGSVMQS